MSMMKTVGLPILAELADSGEVTRMELFDLVRSHQPTLYWHAFKRMLAWLQHDGMVEKVDGGENLIEKFVLTTEGHAVVQDFC